MTARGIALAAGMFAMALTVAQDVRPGLDVYHTWQYAAALALAAVVIAAYVRRALRGKDGPAGSRVAVGLCGALLVLTGGLVSGLIGPDTITVSGSPGTVLPVADLGAAASFGEADAATVARGAGAISLRRSDGSEFAVPPTRPLYLGTSIAYRTTRPAAYVVARDARGNRLTVTQPAGGAFLSPVLLFPQRQPIRDKTYPLDTFALPAVHRIVRALYFSAADAAAFNRVAASSAALVLSVNDDAGKQLAISVALSGREVETANVRVTATAGTYPQLAVAAAPHPALLLGGLLIFAGGAGAALLNTARRSRIETARI
ncbi:MAG: hypothetical protein ABR591_05965 [Candidatus Velthaea sp.]